MKGFKDTTRTKYMCGGPVKKFAGGVMEEGAKSVGQTASNAAAGAAAGAAARAATRAATKSVGQTARNAAAGAAAGAGAGAMAAAAARAATKAIPRGMGQLSEGERRMLMEAAPKKGAAGAKTQQPVQKKSLGGVLKAMSPAAMLADSKVGKDLMKSGVFGLGGVALNALMKKKQSGQPLTPAENQQLAQSQQGQTAMKKGGMAKKGVPVASKKPLIGGLAAMPKGKKC